MTAIEWTDAVWNPTTGCDRVSTGCDRCYALTMAKRLKGMGQAKYQRDGDPATSGPGFAATAHPSALDAPLRWRKPRRVFVNSMSDLFHEAISDRFIAEVFAVMAMASQHTFQVLTKRHGRMRSLLRSERFWRSVGAHGRPIAVRRARGEFPASGPLRLTGASTAAGYWMPMVPLPHVWLGVSVENQQWADTRIPALLDTPAAVRFLSCEPLVGPIDLRARDTRIMQPQWLPAKAYGVNAPDRMAGDGSAIGALYKDIYGPNVDWVIAGGESGAGARPMHPEWARTLRDQCVEARVPFLFKQWGAWSPLAPVKAGVVDWTGAHALADDGTLYAPGDLAYPDGPRYGEAIRAGHDHAALTHVYRIGKKATGRELDGRTWDEYPEPALAAV